VTPKPVVMGPANLHRPPLTKEAVNVRVASNSCLKLCPWTTLLKQAETSNRRTGLPTYGVLILRGMRVLTTAQVRFNSAVNRPRPSEGGQISRITRNMEDGFDSPSTRSAATSRVQTPVRFAEDERVPSE
jgi:hypothetical protein